MSHQQLLPLTSRVASARPRARYFATSLSETHGVDDKTIVQTAGSLHQDLRAVEVADEQDPCTEQPHTDRPGEQVAAPLAELVRRPSGPAGGLADGAGPPANRWANRDVGPP